MMMAHQASNEAACQRACQVENEFLCRSYLFKESSAGLEYNCQLYHLDHFSLPDGPSTFLTTDRPLLDDGEPVGKFVENVCISKFEIIHFKTKSKAEEHIQEMLRCFSPSSIRLAGCAEVNLSLWDGGRFHSIKEKRNNNQRPFLKTFFKTMRI
jgi:hypothetical protein